VSRLFEAGCRALVPYTLAVRFQPRSRFQETGRGFEVCGRATAQTNAKVTGFAGQYYLWTWLWHFGAARCRTVARLHQLRGSFGPWIYVSLPGVSRMNPPPCAKVWKKHGLIMYCSEH
jgi:hypothetical protein